MQQVAASNKDLAAPGLFPGDTVTSDANGSGADFAKVMENQSAENGDPENSEPGYRGHGDFFDTPENKYKGDVSLEEGARKEATIGDGFSDQPVKPIPGDGKALAEQTEQDELHEEWISIIQKLNESEGADEEGVTPILPVDDQGTNILSASQGTNSEAQSDAQGEVLNDKYGLEEKPWHKQEVSLSDGAALNEDTLFQEETLNYETAIAQTAQWKEELKQKLLNSGQAFNTSQINAIEKDLSGLSDAEIQDLLNNDQAFKDMLSDMLNTEELNPHDVALLAALSGAQQSTESTPDTNQDINIDVLNESEVDVSSNDSNDENTQTEQESVPEELLTSASTSNENTQQATDDIKPQPQVTTNPTATESKAQEKLTNLEQVLTDLDSSVKTDEQKVATLESLTRRIESSELAQTPAGKSFIDTMKNATAEFKEQLQSGHEPGININKLVTDAVNAEAGKAESAALQGQVLGAAQNIADVAQTHLSLEPAARENLLSSVQNTLSGRENNLAQTEAGKTQQQNLQNQLLDKAVNINKPEAAQDLANKVQVMMNQKNMVAEFRLDPPDLGQMQVKISMQGDSASVSMVVQSQAAREALEHNEPRLKELLEQQGIELGQSSVQQESRGNKGAGDGSNYASGKGGDAIDELAAEAELDQVVNVNEPDGIDYFA